jgi:ubiquinone/menaquinone biosynthesis C-methylase UbiE
MKNKKVISTWGNYCERYFGQDKYINNNNFHFQVGRTINKQPIDEMTWMQTLDYIEEIMELKRSDDILDLCAGNGLIAIPFSKICNTVTAVDICEPLLKNNVINTCSNIKIIKSDILELDFPNTVFDKVILYFSLQYFTKQEALIILHNVYKWLNYGGLFYIGDIPDQEKLWTFYNTEEREKVYFKSLQEDNPIVGEWFTKTFIKKAGYYSGYSSVRVVDQQSFMFNAHYRFDAILRK